MADMYGSHFEFSGVSSRQYSLIIASIGTKRMVQLGGEKKGVSVFSKSSNKRFLIDDDYSSSPLSFEIEMVTDTGRCLEYPERRRIEKWLFNHSDYRKLYLDTIDDEFGDTYEYVDGVKKRNYLNCRLINPERIEGNGGIVGYRATLEADSNMFWQDAITKQYVLNNAYTDSSSNITVEIDTDMAEYVYPTVTITVGGDGGDIIICNNTDDSSRLTRFIAVPPLASITMKGEINYVSGQYYLKFADRHFIRLLDGENILSIIGNVETIEFEYSVRRAM